MAGALEVSEFDVRVCQASCRYGSHAGLLCHLQTRGIGRGHLAPRTSRNECDGLSPDAAGSGRYLPDSR